MQQNIDEIKDRLREQLFLDIDDYALEVAGEEVISHFIGIRLKSTFQPILERETGAVHGYEALLRPSFGDTQKIGPEFAFSFADQTGRLVKLDRVCRALHTLNYLQLQGARGLLFLNVHPRLLASVSEHGRVFEGILHANSVPTEQVVIEIEERVVDIDRLLTIAIENYRERGYHIAIDNFGGSGSSIDRLWRLTPDYVKLDKRLIQEADNNSRLARSLPKLVEYIHALGARTIIQGIESESQYLRALDSGAYGLQGYWTGKPLPAPAWLGLDAHSIAAA